MNDLTERDIPSVMEEIERAFFDIPFSNSRFQIEHFVINAQHTPERAYRAIGLAMSAKIRALKEALFSLRRQDVDMQEMKSKLRNDNLSSWDRQRLEIDLEEKEDGRRYAAKLINDALAELSVLYGHFKRFHRYTREEFETGEHRHFEIRLQKQAIGLTGPLESLDNMSISELLPPDTLRVIPKVLEGLMIEEKAEL